MTEASPDAPAQAAPASSERGDDDEVRKLNAFLDSIIDNIPAMVFVKDAEHLRYELFNRAGEALSGFKRADIFGKSPEDLFPPEQAAFFMGKDRAVLRNGQMLDIPEEPINTPLGQRWLHTKKIPIFGADGLGLSTVYGIVKQSGGHISLNSAKGRGTSFEIYLPRTLDSAPSSAEDEPAPASAPGSETVLFVEDDEQVRSVAQEILNLQGYRVLAAAAPREALELSARFPEPIQLVVTDVVLPEMNGRELAQRLRAGRPSLRVLYMSGYADKALDAKGALEGAAFLQKPLTPDSLAHAVRRVLDASR